MGMTFKVFNGDTLIKTTTNKRFDVTGLTPYTNYTFGVVPTNGLRDGKKATVTLRTQGMELYFFEGDVPNLKIGDSIKLIVRNWNYGTKKYTYSYNDSLAYGTHVYVDEYTAYGDVKSISDMVVVVECPVFDGTKMHSHVATGRDVDGLVTAYDGNVTISYVGKA